MAAGLLLEQGYDIEGVTMCFELPPGPASDRPRCCGLESIEDARKVCRTLGIPHHVLNYGDALEEAVIKDFVSEYAKGRTPNPCVRPPEALAGVSQATLPATGYFCGSSGSVSSR